MSQSQPTLRAAFGLFFAFIGMPLLVYLAWRNAAVFDPYTQIFFSRFYVEPTAEMPGEIRVAGWIFVGLGGLLALEPLVLAILGRFERKHALLMVWIGALVIAFGGAFFVAADSAHTRIEEEIARETGTT